MVLEEEKMLVEVAATLEMPVGLEYKWIRQYKGIGSDFRQTGACLGCGACVVAIMELLAEHEHKLD